MIDNAINQCPLFADIEDASLDTLLRCLNASRRVYQKDDFVFRVEDKVLAVGIVVSGGVHVIKEDFWGNRVILAHIGQGGMFGEAFSCAGVENLPVSVVAAERSDVMLIDYRKIVESCTAACVFHTRLITNMMKLLAQKNILLTQKMEHLSKRTTREKVLSFLSAEAVSAGNGIVEIPFNRQELADYLCVERSALSRELGVMQREGLLRISKNRFELARGG